MRDEGEGREIGGAEVEGGEVGGGHPCHFGVFFQQGGAGDEAAGDEVELHGECGVCVLYYGDEPGGSHFDVELLAEFAHQCLAWCLALFELAARKFPAAVGIGILAVAAAADEYFPVSIVYYAGRHFDMWQR